MAEPYVRYQRTSKLVKEIRTLLEDMIIAIARVLFFWVPGDVGKGHALMVLHLCMKLWFIPFFLVSPRSPIRLIILCITLGIVATQWIFRGCVVTRAEQRLTGGKETIIDSLVTLMGASATNDTLRVVTITTGTTLAAIMILVYISDSMRPMM
jgi:hypothetical protein